MEQGIERYRGESAVTLDNGKIRAVILPERGAKIASLYDYRFGRELLWQIPGDVYTSMGAAGGAFGPEDSSGFDDMFPTISACSYPEEPWRGLLMPDHGELWSIPWTLDAQSVDSARLSVKGRNFPYVFSRKVMLHDQTLRMEYSVSNRSGRDFHCLWAAHPLLASRPGMYLRVPPSCTELINANETPEMGAPGTRHPWPRSGTEDLSRIGIDTGLTRKFYFAEALEEGFCALVDPQAGMEIVLTFPASELPYLGIWVNEGGWAGQNNVGIEPASGAMDSPVQAARYAMADRIAAYGEKTWFLEIECVGTDPRAGGSR